MRGQLGDYCNDAGSGGLVLEGSSAGGEQWADSGYMVKGGREKETETDGICHE